MSGEREFNRRGGKEGNGDISQVGEQERAGGENRNWPAVATLVTNWRPGMREDTGSL